MDKKNKCPKCKHYYVTWEAAKPHGCHAYGFKSKLIPAIVVQKEDSKGCLLFDQKRVSKKDDDLDLRRQDLW